MDSNFNRPVRAADGSRTGRIIATLSSRTTRFGQLALTVKVRWNDQTVTTENTRDLLPLN